MRKLIFIVVGVMMASAAHAVPVAPIQPDGLAMTIKECRADEGMRRNSKGQCVFDNRACYNRCMTQRYRDDAWCRTSCRY